MRRSGPPPRGADEDPARLRRRPVPSRVLADKVIVARPSDGAPVVLGPTAACVWRHLDGWTSRDAIDRELARAFPDVDADERLSARIEILGLLEAEGLVDRR